MQVKVQLFATLRDYSPDGAKNEPFIVELAEGDTLRSLLDRLQLPEKMPKILLVNGAHRKEPDELHEGDSVSIFPPLAGGSSARS
jgi:molybdopterin converting factor small subunit